LEYWNITGYSSSNIPSFQVKKNKYEFAIQKNKMPIILSSVITANILQIPV